MKNEWRKIKGFDSYMVSNQGKVWSIKRNREIKPWSNGRGYVCVSLRSRGKTYKRLVHRLVAEAFIPNQDKNRTEINHINYIRSDNRVENLEWATRSENMCHSSDNLRKSIITKIEKPSSGERYIHKKPFGGYVVDIHYLGERIYGGYFLNIKDAVEKRNELLDEFGISRSYL